MNGLDLETSDHILMVRNWAADLYYTKVTPEFNTGLLVATSQTSCMLTDE